jgi:hypothetical protein
VTVVRFCDGSLVVPARVSTRDGQVGDGVTRIRHGHPRYDAWRSYCKRHPEHVVERRRQAARINEHLEAGLVLAVTITARTFVFSAFRDEFQGVGLGTAVAAGILCFSFWFLVGLVGSLWFRSSGPRPPSAEVEQPPP